MTLAAMQHYVPNAGDGWTWLLHELETGTRAEEKDLVSAIALLGQRTAELHRALASPSADPAFAPEQIGKREIDAFVARLTAELDQTMSAIASAGVRSEANLDATRQTISRKMSQAPLLEGSLATRVHGDYHLGQVLRTADDFVIIDFEGEPSRPIELRREKASPLKDVAGMLRSLDYAVATLERAGVAFETATFREWGARASAAFVAAYRASIETGGRMILPQSAATFAATLDLYLIEKALYEVRYELDNRPDWLEIPLSALEALGKEPTTAPSGN
ncbi:MAG: phosphotransferase [Chloroflexia bacterium]|nr:phosphotransferase [Chloroflexia bacterium]